MTGIPVLTQRRLDGCLGDPDLIGFVEETDDYPNHRIHDALAMHVMLEVLTIFGMERSHQRYLLLLRRGIRQVTRDKRTMGMH